MSIVWITCVSLSTSFRFKTGNWNPTRWIAFRILFAWRESKPKANKSVSSSRPSTLPPKVSLMISKTRVLASPGEEIRLFEIPLSISPSRRRYMSSISLRKVAYVRARIGLPLSARGIAVPYGRNTMASGASWECEGASAFAIASAGAISVWSSSVVFPFPRSEGRIRAPTWAFAAPNTMASAMYGDNPLKESSIGTGFVFSPFTYAKNFSGDKRMWASGNKIQHSPWRECRPGVHSCIKNKLNGCNSMQKQKKTHNLNAHSNVGCIRYKSLVLYDPSGWLLMT